MKNFSLGLFLIFLNFFVIFINIYIADSTKKILKQNKISEIKISSLKEKIKINELEYSAHLDPIYLKRLENIYIKNKKELSVLNIITRENFNKDFLKTVYKVNAKR